MTVRIMRFTKLLLGLGLAACAWPLSGQNARQEIYADPDKAGGVYYAYTYDNPARTPAPEDANGKKRNNYLYYIFN